MSKLRIKNENGEWVDLIVLKGDQGAKGDDGASLTYDMLTPEQKAELKGKSAYEVATANGFEGTEQEWLASLVGTSSTADSISVEEAIDVVNAAPAKNTSYSTITEVLSQNETRGAGYYDASYQFLDSDTPIVKIDGETISTSKYTFLRHGIIKLGSDYAGNYPETIEVTYQKKSKLVCTESDTLKYCFHNDKFVIETQSTTGIPYAFVDIAGRNALRLSCQPDSGSDRYRCQLINRTENNEMATEVIMSYDMYITSDLLNTIKSYETGRGTDWMEMFENFAPVVADNAYQSAASLGIIYLNGEGKLTMCSRWHTSKGTKSYTNLFFDHTDIELLPNEWMKVNYHLRIGRGNVSLFKFSIEDSNGEHSWTCSSDYDMILPNPEKEQELYGANYKGQAPRTAFDRSKVFAYYTSRPLASYISENCTAPYVYVSNVNLEYYAVNVD